MKFIIKWYGRRVTVALVDRHLNCYTVRLPSGKLVTIFQENIIKVLGRSSKRLGKPGRLAY